MKRQEAEKKIVVLLFVFVIILFSLAQKDSQKIKQLLYTVTEKADKKSARLEPTLDLSTK